MCVVTGLIGDRDAERKWEKRKWRKRDAADTVLRADGGHELGAAALEGREEVCVVAVSISDGDDGEFSDGEGGECNPGGGGG